MITDILGVVIVITLSLLAVFGLATMVFVAIILFDDQKKEEINNKTSE